MVETADIKKSLKDFFGFDSFKGNQEEIIQNVLAGNDCFVIMPTGGGKSMCYQLPALMMNGTAIIISPLIALMKNQVDQIRGFGSNDSVAHFMNSSLTKTEITRVKTDISKGNTKMLYIAPETLKKDDTIEFLKSIKISFVAVDEAHCISEWGHDFRPEYRRIKQMVKAIDDVPMMALTATATPKVQIDIQKNLSMTDAKVFKSSFNRTNLYYEVRPKGKKELVIKDLVGYVKSKGSQSGIIYCLSRKKVEEIAQILKVNGVNALPYHAGMDAKTRASHQDKFLMEDVNVIVATIAFGMGIDKPDVRFVIHYDVPKSLEGYYQETGRAGRDGIESECILYYNPADIEKLEKFMKDKPVAEREIGTQLLFETASFAESSQCRRKILLHYFGEEFDEDDCNNLCDNHRHPRQQVEITEEFTQALTVLQKLDAKHNMYHIIDVIMGTASQEVTSYGHNQLPFFGIGKGKDKVFWKSVIRIALLEGYINKNIEDYGLLRLTDKGRAFIDKPYTKKITLDREFEAISDDDEGSGAAPSALDNNLLKQLKDIRKKVAVSKGVPPYIVFQEPSLEDMATKYPTTMEELENMVGVGKNKAIKYGRPFIDFIAKYVEENDIDRPQDFVVKTVANKSGKKIAIVQNIDKKVNLEDLSRSTGLSFQELLNEVENIVNSGTKLNLRYYINDILDEDRQEEIFDYFKSAESDSLQEAAAEFDGEYSQDELQLVRIQFISELGH